MSNQRKDINTVESNAVDEMRVFDSLPPEYRAMMRDMPYSVSAVEVAGDAGDYDAEEISRWIMDMVPSQVRRAYGPAHPEAG